jgi:hypothetical protein
MKYTSPLYRNEKLETRDVICESPYTIANTSVVIGHDGQGNAITAPGKQVSVDITKLL